MNVFFMVLFCVVYMGYIFVFNAMCLGCVCL